VAATSWRLTWRGRSWSLEDGVTGAMPITGLHALRVAAELGSDTWDAMDPARSPNALMTWLAVLVADGAEDLAPAYDEITSANVSELLGSLTFTDQSEWQELTNGPR
jgi:hypothetical protein